MSDNSSSGAGCGCFASIVWLIFFTFLIYLSQDWNTWFWSLTWGNVGWLFLKFLLIQIAVFAAGFGMQFGFRLIFEIDNITALILGILLTLFCLVTPFALSYWLFTDGWNWFFFAIKGWFV